MWVRYESAYETSQNYYSTLEGGQTGHLHVIVFTSVCISVKNGAPASTLMWVLGSHEHACSISAVTSPTWLLTTFVYAATSLIA